METPWRQSHRPMARTKNQVTHVCLVVRTSYESRSFQIRLSWWMLAFLKPFCICSRSATRSSPFQIPWLKTVTKEQSRFRRRCELWLLFDPHENPFPSSQPNFSALWLFAKETKTHLPGQTIPAAPVQEGICGTCASSTMRGPARRRSNLMAGAPSKSSEVMVVLLVFLAKLLHVYQLDKNMTFGSDLFKALKGQGPTYCTTGGDVG